jgi:hypothetical protein
MPFYPGSVCFRPIRALQPRMPIPSLARPRFPPLYTEGKQSAWEADVLPLNYTRFQKISSLVQRAEHKSESTRILSDSETIGEGIGRLKLLPEYGTRRIFSLSFRPNYPGIRRSANRPINLEEWRIAFVAMNSLGRSAHLVGQ